MIYEIIALIATMIYMFPQRARDFYIKYLVPIIIFLTNYLYAYFVTLLRNYLMTVLTDEKLNQSLNNMLKGQLDKLLTDEDLNAQLIRKVKLDAQIISEDAEMNSYIHEIIQKQLESSDSSERTRAAIAKIAKTQIEGATQEEWLKTEVKNQIMTVVVNTCESVEVKDKLRELLEKLSSDLIDSGEINKKLNDLLQQIINNEDFLKNTGSGIRRSLRHTVWGMFGTYPTDAEKEKEKTDKEKADKEKNANDITPTVIIEKELERPQAEKLKVSIVTKNRSNSMSNVGGSGIIENPKKGEIQYEII